MTEPDTTEVRTDEELSIQLHRLLVVEGHDSVQIIHATEGSKIVTKDNYLEISKALDEVDGMTDEQKIARADKIEKKNRQKLKKWMKTADVRYVDIADDANFGLDIAGDPIPMTGLSFVPVEQYLDGITIQDDEVGAFIDEYMAQHPIRIIHKSTFGLSDTMQQLADDCPPQDLETLLDNLDEKSND
jgi:hypothetical protein